jgi:hypothetical protein
LAVIGVAVIDEATLTATKMLIESPEVRLASVQVMFPVAPTAGVVQVQPAGGEIEEKVVLAGTASRKLIPVAVAGPLFVIV